MAQENMEVTGILMIKVEQEVIEDISITPQGIPIGDHTSTQVHPLFESFKKGLGWMRYEEK
jgi:hypothetical protein